MIIGIDIGDTHVQTNKRALEIIKREKINETVTYYEELQNYKNLFITILKK